MVEEKNKRKRRDNTNDSNVIMPVAMLETPEGYTEFLQNLKNRVRTERLKAVLSANSAQIMLYWEIGNLILEKQLKLGWGAKVIDRLSIDLKYEFPDMSGFSPRNLKYMRKFAETWKDFEFVQRVVAQIPWRNNLALLEKLKDSDLMLWYAKQNIQNGWNKDVLIFQIESELHKRLGNAENNFEVSLPPADSDLAVQVFKDPYIFDFLGTADLRRELELENKLIEHLEKFLLELGQGFAFVGRQVHLELGGDDFYIDLLFYHLKLRCYVVVELKAGKFSPGHVSQLTMYMNVVDKVLRHETDKATIGLLLVREKNNTVVKYSLAGNNNPIGVAEWEQQITESLPEELKSNLPTIEEIEKELEVEVEK